MTVDDGACTPFLDVAVHLLGHLLALEFHVSAVEVLGVDPRDRFAVDLHVVEEEQVRRSNGPAVLKGLLLDHVEINGEPVAWIDAKHFYGADVDFQRKKMAKQMNRYIEEWGAGAIVYRHGFCANLFIPGVTLLDAGPLDLSPLK